jgi:hypothetical protein
MLMMASLLAAPVALHAQPAAPAAKDREVARTLLISGREKLKSGNVKGALADFTQAHAIMHVPTTGLDLGKAQVASGLLLEARATLLETAKMPAKPKEPPAFARARQDAKFLAEALKARLGTVTVNIKGVPPGKKVALSVDGVEVSDAVRSVPFLANPGVRTIAASYGGSKADKQVELTEGGNQLIEFTLIPTNTVAAGGEVDLDTGAAASAGGAPKGSTPPPPESEPTPYGAEAPSPAPAPEPAKKSTNPLVYAGLAATGLGIGVGTITGLSAISTYSKVEPRCVKGLCPPATHSDIDNGVTMATVSTVAFIFAGVGAGVTVYGLLSPRKTPKATAGVRVIPTPAGIAGTF